MSVPTIHSARHGVDLPLGKDAATAPRFTIYEDEIRPKLKAKGLVPTVPQMFGHGHDFPQGKWLMLGNGPDDTVAPGFEGVGDCAWADPAHDEMEAASDAGRPIPRFTGLVVVEQYAEYEGWKGGDVGSLLRFLEANDNGSNMQDVIEIRQTKGFRDADGKVYKIGKAISLKDPGNVSMLWELAWLTENVDLGIVVTEANQEQFGERAQPTWEYVKGSPEVGGHAVPVMGRLGLISWAEDVYYGVPFIAHQADEAHAYLDIQRYNARTGETAEGFTEQDLEKYLTLEAEAKLARLR
jgi:hypothetical protein